MDYMRTIFSLIKWGEIRLWEQLKTHTQKRAKCLVEKKKSIHIQESKGPPPSFPYTKIQTMTVTEEPRLQGGEPVSPKHAFITMQDLII